MKELFRKYAYHIDFLRGQRKIKINDFCEGVCEPRTYRYYLSGSRIMSHTILNGFCKKLGFTPAEFYASYNGSDREEYYIVYKLYRNIMRNNFEQARKLLIVLDGQTFINPLSKSLYDYCVIEYNSRNNVITKDAAYSMFKKLINYPQCLDKMNFTIQETLTIQAIALLELQSEKKEAFNFLCKLLNNPEYNLVSSIPREILPTLYSTVAYQYITDDNYKEAKITALNGIKFCLQSNTLLDLDNLYYYCAYSDHKLKNDTYELYARKFLATTIAKYNDDYIKKRVDIFKQYIGDNPYKYLYDPDEN